MFTTCRGADMDLGIAGRKALVCAASKGLGRGCAEALAREGVEVTILARTESTVRQTAVKGPIDILGLSNGARSGLTGFVAGVARKVARHNVTINNILPGQFETDRMRATMEGRAKAAGKPFDEVRRGAMEAIPAGRFGTPAEFGALCAFLCSVHSGYIAGQNLLIDGGNYPGTF